ncbi:hypothetical protein [Streptomyces sp. NPDC058103]
MAAAPTQVTQYAGCASKPVLTSQRCRFRSKCSRPPRSWGIGHSRRFVPD